MRRPSTSAWPTGASTPWRSSAGAAEELAVRLAQGPTRSLGLSKQLLNASFETTLPASLDREAHFQALGTVSPEMAEGMAAFKERRTPDFIGSSGSAGD